MHASSARAIGTARAAWTIDQGRRHNFSAEGLEIECKTVKSTFAVSAR